VSDPVLRKDFFQSATSRGKSAKLATLAWGAYMPINNVLLPGPGWHALLTLPTSIQ